MVRENEMSAYLLRIECSVCDDIPDCEASKPEKQDVTRRGRHLGSFLPQHNWNETLAASNESVPVSQNQEEVISAGLRMLLVVSLIAPQHASNDLLISASPLPSSLTRVCRKCSLINLKFNISCLTISRWIKYKVASQWSDDHGAKVLYHPNFE